MNSKLSRAANVIVSSGDAPDVFDDVAKLRASGERLPILIATSPADEEANDRAVRAGALAAVEPQNVRALVAAFERSLTQEHREHIDASSRVFDLAPTGIVTATIDGYWIRANNNLCELLGFTRAELRMLPFFSMTHPDDQFASRNRIARLLAGLTSRIEGVKRYVRKDGSTMWGSVATEIARDDNGEIGFMITTIHDITAAQAAEEKVRFQARLLACAEEAIVAVDNDHRVLYWNAGAERLYGWSAEEATGRVSSEVIKTSLSTTQENEVLEFVRRGRSWSGEIDLTGRDGRVFPAAVTDSPIFDVDGNLIGIVGISRDISVRRRAEVALNRRYSHLQATTDLGRLALRGAPVEELFRFASTCVSAVLDVEIVEISKRVGRDMLLAGGSGWRNGEIQSLRTPISSEYVTNVIESDEAIVSNSVFRERGVVSSLAMRVAGDDEGVWGLIAAHATSPRTFDVDDSLFLMSIANTLADAIHRRATEMELHTRAERQSAIADLSRFALSAVSDKEVISAACSVVGALLHADHPIFLRYDEAKDVLFAAGGKPWLPAAEKNIATKANHESLAGFVLSTGESVIVHDYKDEERFDADRIFVRHGLVSGIAAPVRGASRIIGVIAGHTKTRCAFTRSDAQFLTAIGNVLAQAIERNAARRDLAASEMRHRLVVEGASEVIFATDMNGFFTGLNPAFEAMTGWMRDEWIGRSLRDLVIITDEVFEKTIARLRRGERVEETELRIRGKSREILVEANAFVRGTGDTREIYGFARDITEAHAFEEERRSLLSELQLVLESTDEGIYAVDTDGRCALINPAGAKMFGYEPEELIGKDVHATLHAKRPDGSAYPDEECPIYRVLNGLGKAQQGSGEVFWTADGMPIVVDYSASPIISNGVVRGVVVTCKDITERRKLESQLEQAKRLGSLGRLAATVAHEFNNVLMSISPFAEIARRDSTTTRGSNACEQILKAVRRGKSVTEEILRFTQPSDPKLASIHTADWLSGFAEDTQSIVGNRFEVIVQCERDLPDISADEHQLNQAFTNLVTNARDSMLSGGTIEVGARRESKSTVFSFGVVHNAEHFVHFWVRDNGVGMSSEVLQHIFEPLYTTKRNGTGLGLAVTHQVVKRHGGELFVESRVGRGATFHLFMPIAQTTTLHAEAIVMAGNAERTRFRNILIVEDEPAVAEGIAAVLRLEGAHVTVVGTGAAAIEQLSVARPDAMILDIGLPDMDGHKVYEHLASFAPTLPVVFSTGHERSPSAEYSPRKTAWLMKPYELDVLLGALDTLAAEANVC
jgi:PAS domain S-box-containing protein